MFWISYGWKSEERYGEHAETGCHDFPHPGPRNCIPVPYGGHRDDTPPKGISIAREIASIFTVGPSRIFLRQIHEVAAEYEAEETDV